MNWLRLAPAIVLSGDEEGYAAFREKLVGNLGDDPSLEVCERTIKSCLLLPPPPGFVDRLPVARVRELLEQGDQGPSTEFYYAGLALAELRTGSLADAEAHTVTGLEKQRGGAPDSMNLAVQSMAQARQGKLKEARRSLDEATRILNSAYIRPHDYLIGDILNREAETLLKELEEK